MYFSSIVGKDACDQYRICEHDMPCALMLRTLEKVLTTDLSKHVESYSSTDKNLSLRPQCLCPPNLAEC